MCYKTPIMLGKPYERTRDKALYPSSSIAFACSNGSYLTPFTFVLRHDIATITKSATFDTSRIE